MLYAERERIKKQLKEVETIKGNVDRILGNEEERELKPFVMRFVVIEFVFYLFYHSQCQP